MTEPRRRPTSHADAVRSLDPPEPDVRWLALVLAEMLRTGLALIAKRYPEAQGKAKCPHCGWRHG